MAFAIACGPASINKNVMPKYIQKIKEELWNIQLFLNGSKNTATSAGNRPSLRNGKM
jgi:hypothetical protein